MQLKTKIYNWGQYIKKSRCFCDFYLNFGKSVENKILKREPKKYFFSWYDLSSLLENQLLVSPLSENLQSLYTMIYFTQSFLFQTRKILTEIVFFVYNFQFLELLFSRFSIEYPLLPITSGFHSIVEINGRKYLRLIMERDYFDQWTQGGC